MLPLSRINAFAFKSSRGVDTSLSKDILFGANSDKASWCPASLACIVRWTKASLSFAFAISSMSRANFSPRVFLKISFSCWSSLNVCNWFSMTLAFSVSSLGESVLSYVNPRVSLQVSRILSRVELFSCMVFGALSCVPAVLVCSLVSFSSLRDASLSMSSSLSLWISFTRLPPSLSVNVS